MITLSDNFEFVLAALAKLVILAMLLERGLYFIFDYSLWRDWLSGKKIRAPITLAAAWFICWWHEFDVIAPLLDPEVNSTPFGIFITALIVAGGSAAAITLFQDVLKFSRTARGDLQKLRVEKNAAAIDAIKAKKQKVEAEAEVAKAEAKRLAAEAAKAEAEAKKAAGL